MFIVCKGNSKSATVEGIGKVIYQTESEYKDLAKSAKSLGFSIKKDTPKKAKKKSLHGPVTIISGKDYANHV